MDNPPEIRVFLRAAGAQPDDLGACIDTLRHQSRLDLQVSIDTQDASPQALHLLQAQARRDPRIRLQPPPPPTTGWQATLHPRCRLHPEALATLLSRAEQQGLDHVLVLGAAGARSPIGHLLLPILRDGGLPAAAAPLRLKRAEAPPQIWVEPELLYVQMCGSLWAIARDVATVPLSVRQGMLALIRLVGAGLLGPLLLLWGLEGSGGPHAAVWGGGLVLWAQLRRAWLDRREGRSGVYGLAHLPAHLLVIAIALAASRPRRRSAWLEEEGQSASADRK